jgi:hypothetical protein
MTLDPAHPLAKTAASFHSLVNAGTVPGLLSVQRTHVL